MNAASNPCHLASFSKSKNMCKEPRPDLDSISNQMPRDQSSDANTRLQLVEENIIPSLDEINYCIRKKILTKKDHILVKMVLDYNEAKWQRMTEDQN